MMERLRELQLVLLFFTRLPAGQLVAPVPSLANAAWAFPLAGLAIGLLATIALIGALRLGFSPAIAAGLALSVQIIATGALHEDGLADVADGLWGGATTERRLEIMRDSRIGSYGTLALILTLGLRWLALSELAEHATSAAVALVVCAMASRLAPAALLTSLPSARDKGLGASAGKPSRASLGAAALLALLPAVLLIPAFGLHILGALALAAALTFALARLARSKLGGQTGDVLGASQQLAELALLLWLSRSALGSA